MMRGAARANVSLSDRAYLAIREEILRGQLRPGTALSRRRLAKELGMSVVPVTEALRQLQSDGLVESRARAGTRVRVPTEKDVRELYELREALETQSARLCAERGTPAQFLELRRLGDHLDALFGRLASGDEDAAFRFAVHSHHVQFHMRIAQYAGSHMLEDAIERNHVLILNWLLDVTARRTPLPKRFHAELVEAVTSGEAARADAAMRAHVRYGLKEIVGQLRHLTASEWRERRGRRASVIGAPADEHVRAERGR
jgi:DNA-binding GntR family transcriptional regulator